jgi:hypothetical protein
LIAALASRRDLGDDAVAALAGRLGRTASELRGKLAGQTEADRAVFLEGLAADQARGPAALVRLLLRWQGRPTFPPPASLVDALLRALGWPERSELRLAEALAAVVPESAWPAVLLVDERPEPRPDWIAGAVRSATALATRLPRLPFGVVAPADWIRELLHTGTESQALALLREGLIELPAADDGHLVRRVQEAGLEPSLAQSAIEAVALRGADPDLTKRLVNIAGAVAGLDGADEAAEERARSLAEQFLFDLLDSHPATSGLFQLNGVLDFTFGPRPMEVDLVAPMLRLAVELDGRFWHLRDPEAYRRDRRKDWELQRRGFLVLRFLAEDVVCRLHDILDTIVAAVAIRRSANLGEY